MNVSQHTHKCPSTFPTNSGHWLEAQLGEQSIHGYPLPATLIEILVNNTLHISEAYAVMFSQCKDILLILPGHLSARGLGLGLIDIPQAGEVEKLSIDSLFCIFVTHSTKTISGQSLGAKAARTINTHLPCSIAALAIIADQPALVVPTCLSANGVLHLGHDRECRDGITTRAADDTELGHMIGRRSQALEHGRVFALATTQREASTITEADLVWNLRVQGVDLKVIA